MKQRVKNFCIRLAAWGRSSRIAKWAAIAALFIGWVLCSLWELPAKLAENTHARRATAMVLAACMIFLTPGAAFTSVAATRDSGYTQDSGAEEVLAAMPVVMADGEIPVLDANNSYQNVKYSLGSSEPKTAKVFGLINKTADTGSGNVLTIPAQVKNAGGTVYDVTGINEAAFTDATLLKEVIIPNGVTTIGQRAFEGATQLEKVVIPSSVTTIGTCAFQECSSLVKVEIPNGVTEIKQTTFNDCSSLTTVIIPASVTTIYPYAFEGCGSLAALDIPANVTTIYSSAFCGIKSGAVVTLQYEALPDSITAASFETVDKSLYYISAKRDVAAAIGEKYALGDSSKYFGIVITQASVPPFDLDNGSLKLSHARNTTSGSARAYGGYTISGLKDSQEIVTTSSNRGYDTFLSTDSAPAFDNSVRVRLPGAGGVETYVKSGIWANAKSEFTSDGNLRVTYTLRNGTDADISNVSLGVNANVMIGTDDKASIYTTSTGLRMVNTKTGGAGSGMQFTLHCKDTTNVDNADNVDALWYGKDDGGAFTYLFSDLENKADLIGQDSALAFSWQGMSIPANGKITRSVVFGFGAAAAADKITIEVNGGATEYKGADLEAAVKASGKLPINIAKLKITAGEVTAADWNYFAGGTPGNTHSPFTYLETFEIADAVTTVADMPDGSTRYPLFPAEVTTVTIPQATKVGGYAFKGCAALRTVYLPKVKNVGEDAFTNCTKLTSISLPVVTNIGNSAFFNCQNLAELRLPAAPPVSFSTAFDNCPFTRRITFVNADDRPLADAELTKAQEDYDNVTMNFNRAGDDKWYGWWVREQPKITITVDGGAAVGGADLKAAVTASGVTANTITALKITAGEVTADDWKYFAGGTPGTTKSPFTALTTFEVDAAVTKVENIPNGASFVPIFPISIQTVTMPQVITVGNHTFFGCKDLTKVNLPKAATIDSYAFFNCKSLSSVSLPAATTVNEGAFGQCDLLATLELPKVTHIGGMVFMNCPQLATLKLPAAPPIITGGEFSGCPKTNPLVIVGTDGTTPLEGDALANAQKAYDDVTANGNVANDGKWYGWKVREPVVLEAKWEATGGGVGEGTLAEALAAVKASGGTITLLGDVTDTTNPLMVTISGFSKPVTLVLNGKTLHADVTFESLTGLFTVDGTAAGSKIQGTTGPAIFSDGTNLKLKGGSYIGASGDGEIAPAIAMTVAASDTKEKLKTLLADGYAFESETGFTVINIGGQSMAITGNSVKVVPATFPITITVNTDPTPYGGESLQAAVAASKVPVASITKLTITAGEVTATDWNWLNRLTKLTHFTISTAIADGKVANIPDGADFSVIFPESIVSVTIPQAIAVGEYAFAYCGALTTVALPKATKIGDSAFLLCKRLASVSLPKATSIGEMAFQACEALTTVVLPEASSIKKLAFSACNVLASVSLPKVTSIGDYAFRGCPLLTTLKLPATPPTSMGSSVFTGCPPDRSLKLVKADGNELTGADLATAQGKYREVSDDNAYDNLWYGWKLGAAPELVAVTGVTLDKTTLSLEAGKTAQLTETVAPATATNKAVTWKTSAADVATVDTAGKVTAVKPGTATITVTTKDGGKNATCAVTVTAATTKPAPGGKLEAPLTQDKVDDVFGPGNATLNDKTTPSNININNNITVEKPVEVETDVTIDLGGNTITGKDNQTPIVVGDDKDVTIKGPGSVIGGNGTGNNPGKPGVDVGDNSNTNVGGGTNVSGGSGSGSGAGGSGIAGGDNANITVGGGSSVTGGQGGSSGGSGGAGVSGGSGTDITIGGGSTATGGTGSGSGSGGSGVSGGNDADITIGGGSTATGGTGSGSGSGGSGVSGGNDSDITIDGGKVTGGQGGASGGNGGAGASGGSSTDIAIGGGSTATGGAGGSGGNGGSGAASGGNVDINSGTATGGNGGAGGSGGNGAASSGGDVNVSGGGSATGGSGGNTSSGTGGAGGSGTSTGGGSTSVGGSASGGNGGAGSTAGGAGGSGSVSTGGGSITVDGKTEGGNGGSGATGGTGGNGTTTGGSTTVNGGGSATGGTGGAGSTAGGNGGNGASSGSTTVSGGATGGNGGSGKPGSNGNGGNGGNGVNQGGGTVGGSGTATGGNGGSGMGAGSGGTGGAGVGGGALVGNELHVKNGIGATVVIEGKPGTTVSIPDAGAAADAVMSEDEKKNPNITAVKVTLKVDDKTAAKPDQAAVESKKPANSVIGAFFDITLQKTITKNNVDGSPETVTDVPNGTVTITIEIPSGMRNGVKNSYVVIRVHNGISEALATTQSGNELTFATDKFSTYAIAYTPGGPTDPDPNPDRGSNGGGSSADDDQYSFWMQVKERIQNASSGDVIKVNAKDYDKLPWSVMDALRENSGVGLVIEWNGETITIPAGKAQKNEPERIYWPLSRLDELYTGIAEDTVLKPAVPEENPTTGGPDRFVPVGGGELITLEAPAPTIENALPDGAENAQAIVPTQPKAITPPDAGFEKEVFAGTPDNPQPKDGVNAVSIVLLIAASAIGGLWYWKRQHQN